MTRLQDINTWLVRLIPLAMIMIPTLVLAEEKDSGFDERKAKALEHVDKRIGSLNEMKTCISSATEGSAMKDCHIKHKESMKGMAIEGEESRHEKRMNRLKK